MLLVTVALLRLNALSLVYLWLISVAIANAPVRTLIIKQDKDAVRTVSLLLV